MDFKVDSGSGLKARIREKYKFSKKREEIECTSKCILSLLSARNSSAFAVAEDGILLLRSCDLYLQRTDEERKRSFCFLFN